MPAPIERTAPKPTPTTVDAREAAKARAAAPSSKNTAKKSEPSFIERALNTVGLSGAVKAAKEGAAKVAKAGSDQPTPERAVVAKVIEAGKAQLSVTAAAAGDVLRAGKAVAAPIVAAGVAAADRVTKPVRREIAEAASEVGEAGANIVNTQKDNVSETIREVKDAWNNAPTPERAVIAAGYELLENGVQNHVRTIGSLLNFGKEAAEGAFEIAINNPVTEAGKIAVTEAGKGLWNAAGAIFGFGKNVAERGANGAVEAGKSIASTGTNIVSRTIDQHRENAREVFDAGRNVVTHQLDRIQEGRDEVADAWNSQPTIERQLAVAGYEVVENSIQNALGTAGDIANVGKEVAEAAVENTVNTVKNGVDVVTGAAGAVGSFVGGLFD